MRLPRTSTVAGLALTAVCALALRTELAFTRAEGSEAAKEFRLELALELDTVEVIMNGQEVDPAMMGIPGDLSASVGYLMSLSDEYRAVSGGRPTELLRTFEAFETWTIDADGTEERETDDLAGRTVLFEWDEDDEAYERSFADDEGGDEDALAMLAEDLDLRGLLPDGEVDEGDEWDVSGASLAGVLLPGLDLRGALESEQAEEAPEFVIDAIESMLEEAGGTCTFEGFEDVDGRALAVILVEASLDATLDVDPEEMDIDMGAELDDFSMDVSLELEAEGRCLWDVEAGSFHSFELEGFGSLLLDVAMTASEMGMDLEGSAEFTISLENSALAE